MSSPSEREAAVPGLYDFISLFFVAPSFGKYRDIHYQMNTPHNTHDTLAQLARAREDDVLLDAGCGQGSSVRWLSKNIGCKIDALTIGKREARLVERLVKKKEYRGRIRALQGNMLDTKLPNESYSVVWAIESMCHIEDKLAFLRESYRVMKPGGRLVIADIFLTEKYGEVEDKDEYEHFCDGAFVPRLVSKQDFIGMLVDAGFRNIRYEDYSQVISKNVRTREIGGWSNYILFFPLIVLRLFPRLLTTNYQAMIAQGKFFRHNKFSYGIVYAEK